MKHTGPARCAPIMAAWGTALWLLGFSAGAASAVDTNSLELAVKATFIYKFQFYVSWPSRVFASPSSPFTVCIDGSDPFGDLIDQAVSGQSVGGRAISVLRLRSVAADDRCQMLYIATGDPRSTRQELTAVAGRPVLTITDEVSEDAAKGMINFVMADDRVRFEIDAAAAARSGLPISSKLLDVALSVRTKP